MTDFYAYIYYDGSVPIYVGKGKGSRAYDHLQHAKNKHLKNKLAKMKREGRDPVIEIFEMPDEQSALNLEVWWIALFGRKDLGLGPLCNLTDGGEGQFNPSAETREKLKSSLAIANAKPEVKLRKSLAAKESCNRPSTKEKIQTKRKVTLLDPEVQQRISSGLKKAFSNPVVKAKMSEAHSKPCEVHGVQFKSRAEAITAFGQGKSGIKHPSFRYL